MNEKYIDFFDKIDDFNESELLHKIYDLTKGNNLNFLISLFNDFSDYYYTKHLKYFTYLSKDEVVKTLNKENEANVIDLSRASIYFYELNKDILNKRHHTYFIDSKDFDQNSKVILNGYEFIVLMNNLIIQSCTHAKIELRDEESNECFYSNYPNIEKNNETDSHQEKYKTQILFNVGLLFASGKMEKFYDVNNLKQTVFKSGYSAPKVARELKNKNYEKFILASISNYTKENSNGNKNIFNSYNMMQKVIAHCDAENILVIDYFKERLPIE